MNNKQKILDRLEYMRQASLTHRQVAMYLGMELGFTSSELHLLFEIKTDQNQRGFDNDIKDLMWRMVHGGFLKEREYVIK